MFYDIKDINLAAAGRQRIDWAERQMPVLRQIRQRFSKERPLKGITLTACLHVTSETANLMRTLQAAGAAVFLCAANPLSTQDEVAASLVKDFNIPILAKAGEDKATYYQHLNQVLDKKPQITMDDGGDLVTLLHQERKDQLEKVWGSSEETTTGVIRLKAMAKNNALKIPVIAVNDSQTKHLFDNRYGTGQSTIDGILRATNMLLAGKVVVIAGYGWCGRGVAARAKGMNARVIITEVDPLKALEAVMDGFEVMPMSKAVKIGDLFITVTGNTSILRGEHFQQMKDGAVLANTGHFNVEIDVAELEKQAKSKKQIRPYVVQYLLKGGKNLYLLGEGRIINLVAAEGHPSGVMDMSFANQALAAEYIAKNHHQLQPKVYVLPREIDSQIALLKLKSLRIEIDHLTDEQKEYLCNWQKGT